MKQTRLIAVMTFVSIVFANNVFAMDAKMALQEASASGQYLFLTFYETTDEPFKAMTSVLETFKKTSKKKITFFNAKMGESDNKTIAEQHGIKSTHLPVLLVIAPNGAITGGFSKTINTAQLEKSVNLSDLIVKTLKPLQEQKVVLVSLRNGSTLNSEESWKGVNDFVSDPQFQKFSVAVSADPAAKGSLEFLKQCGLPPTMSDATVVILLPPGRIAKILTGKLTKDDILKSLQSCASGCGGGCSDRRLKKEISPITSALDLVAKLQGVHFLWNREDYPTRFFPEGRQIGLIAQDVESVIPEVVLTDSEGYKSVTYDKLTVVLIEAVKELHQKVQDQEAMIKVQSERIRALETDR